MDFDTFRQQPFAPTLAAPRKSGTAGFRAHARAKTMLILSGALRALECSFHLGRLLGSAYLTGDIHSVNCLS